LKQTAFPAFPVFHKDQITVAIPTDTKLLILVENLNTQSTISENMIFSRFIKEEYIHLNNIK
jgi:hypothetical protein